MIIKMKLKKQDKVKVMVGKDKGREGVIEKIFPKIRKILVSGVNISKKHSRGKGGGKGSGGIIDITSPLPISNVALICPKCGKTTGIGSQKTPEGKKRICKKCKSEI